MTHLIHQFSIFSSFFFSSLESKTFSTQLERFVNQILKQIKKPIKWLLGAALDFCMTLCMKSELVQQPNYQSNILQIEKQHTHFSVRNVTIQSWVVTSKYKMATTILNILNIKGHLIHLMKLLFFVFMLTKSIVSSNNGQRLIYDSQGHHGSAAMLLLLTRIHHSEPCWKSKNNKTTSLFIHSNSYPLKDCTKNLKVYCYSLFGSNLVRHSSQELQTWVSQAYSNFSGTRAISMPIVPFCITLHTRTDKEPIFNIPNIAWTRHAKLLDATKHWAQLQCLTHQ